MDSAQSTRNRRINKKILVAFAAAITFIIVICVVGALTDDDSSGSQADSKASPQPSVSTARHKPAGKPSPSAGVARVGSTAAQMCLVINAQLRDGALDMPATTADSFAARLPLGSHVREAAFLLAKAESRQQVKAYGAELLKACEKDGWSRPTME